MTKIKTPKELELEIARKNYEIEMAKIELKYFSQEKGKI